MDDAVPRKPSIVDNDMDLPVPKLRGLLHDSFQIRVVLDVADDGEGAAGGGIVDGLHDAVGVGCCSTRRSVYNQFLDITRRVS